MQPEDTLDEAEIELEEVETEGQETDSDSSPDTEEVQEKQTDPDWRQVRARFDPVQQEAYKRGKIGRACRERVCLYV